MRLIVIGLTLFFSVTSSWGARVKIELAPFDELLAVSDVMLTQVQMKVQCQFVSHEKKNPKTIVRERYILTRLDRIEEGSYRIRTGKASFSTWMPEYQLKSCRYQMIALAEDFSGTGLIGDFSLLDDELNRKDAHARIKRRLNSIVLGKQGDFDQAFLADISRESN